MALVLMGICPPVVALKFRAAEMTTASTVHGGSPTGRSPIGMFRFLCALDQTMPPAVQVPLRPCHEQRMAWSLAAPAAYPVRPSFLYAIQCALAVPAACRV